MWPSLGILLLSEGQQLFAAHLARQKESIFIRQVDREAARDAEGLSLAYYESYNTSYHQPQRWPRLAYVKCWCYFLGLIPWGLSLGGFHKDLFLMISRLLENQWPQPEEFCGFHSFKEQEI